MNEKCLRILEYHKIINQLKEYASSPIGKRMCEELIPVSNYDLIVKNQQETSDAVSRIYRSGSISFSGTRDIRASLKRLSVGSTLGIGELLDISSVLNVATRVKAFSRKETDDEFKDSLDGLFQCIEPLTQLNNEIKRCIISEEEIADDASSNLKQIRRTIKNTNDQIHSHLNSMVNSSNTRTYLQDYVITMRNGRYCLPIKQEYRNHVPGMIHDQSSSGSTLFVEPMAVVKLNNDLRELEHKEQDEIEVILATLSNQAAEFLEALETDLHTLSTLDFIFAKAVLSRHYKGSEPVFNQRGYIRIKKGRHPLLDPKTVVPIDIHLGDQFHLLIVTGPNTGGKTVSLKTVGLFTLMGQAGLHIPAFDHSELAVFEEVYADIGDEQSIEQSLSTFSSHMTNIVSILEKADDKSLVLFDELGAGTDPTEGAALAISILSFLHKMQVRTMATTHYSELKVFALTTEGVENACCEFSVETLRPTYRLLIGIPGKSNAFAISGKLGLPAFIIEDAKSRIDANDEAFEDLIADLEHSKVTIEREQEEIQKYKEEVENLKQQLEKKQERLEIQKEHILKAANEEAYRTLQEAKEFADQTIRNFNKMSQNAGAKEMENERHKLRGKLNDVEGKLAYQPGTKAGGKKKASEYKIGDAVKVLSLNLEGTVSTLPNAKGDLFVTMGILRSQVNVKDLEPIDEPASYQTKPQRTSGGKIKMSKASTISTEINLIGKTVDEAIAALDKYLDDAYLTHLPQVTIVHGKGTGALRNAVHSHLKRLKYVKAYRLGTFGEGEAGVTIVEFK